MASTDATAIPVKNQDYRLTFPILDADGDLVTGATGLDSEVSKDAGTFADCTNEATEIATNSGMYYLDLTSTEMNADTVAIIVKTSSSGAKTTPIVLYPQEAGDIKVNVTYVNGVDISATGAVPELGIVRRGTAQSATATTLVMDAAAAFGDNTLVGATLMAYGSTQGYWQERIITANTGSTDTCTVDTWPVTPSGTISYIIFATAPSVAAAITNVNVTQISGDSTAADNLEAMLDGTGGVALTATFTGNLTGNVGGNVTGNVGGNVTGTVGSVVGAVGSVTGAVGSVTGNVGGNVVGSVASVTGNVGGNVTGTVSSIANAGIDALYTRALTESYATDGAAPTVAQALFAIQQFLQEKVISGTSLTIKKLDGATTAMTFLLNDATTPTSVTRTS